jgi:hypothetical protein
LSRWGTSLYLQLQKLDLKGSPIARWVDRLNTRWLRMSPKVASGGLAYARQHGADRMFCGHTHEALHTEQDGIHYYNAGGWVDSRLTYLTIDEQGVEIHEFDENEFDEHKFDEHEFDEHPHRERVDDRDSGEERGEADSAIADIADESGLLADVQYESVGS